MIPWHSDATFYDPAGGRSPVSDTVYACVKAFRDMGDDFDRKARAGMRPASPFSLDAATPPYDEFEVEELERLSEMLPPSLGAVSGGGGEAGDEAAAD